MKQTALQLSVFTFLRFAANWLYKQFSGFYRIFTFSPQRPIRATTSANGKQWRDRREKRGERGGQRSSANGCGAAKSRPTQSHCQLPVSRHSTLLPFPCPLATPSPCQSVSNSCFNIFTQRLKLILSNRWNSGACACLSISLSLPRC